MTTHDQFGEDLALYAMGSLPADEAALMEEHLRTCRECQAELRALRADFAALAIAAPEVAPPASSRQRLLSSIAREPRSAPEPKRPSWWTIFVPTFAALALAFFAINLWQENTSLKRDLATAEQRAVQQSATVEQAQRVLETFHARDAQRFTLVAANARPQPQAQTVYSREKGRLVLLASNLPQVPTGKAYELWLLPMSGAAPMPAGMFRPDERGNASLMLPPLPAGMDAKGFAMTIEPESGSQTPTMPIVMVATGS
jgi:anti-sigma-K factor RskA